MMRIRLFAAAVLMAFAASTGAAAADPTEIVVRVISKDAKFVGSTMGGVRITLHDTETGELLATGVTAGSTGDTQRIVKQPRDRGRSVSDPKSAKFAAVLDLDRPRLIRVTAYGPLAQKQAAVHVSSTQWVVPGKHVKAGDAWLLEMPGFVVDVLDLRAQAKPAGTPQKIALKAKVTMMCGCPITPGGVWDADTYEVAAILTRNGKPLRTVPLAYAGTASQFAAEIEVADPGVYEAVVYAHDPANGNTGLDRVTFVVRPTPPAKKATN